MGNRNRLVRALLGAPLLAALAAPAFAGTVYSWVTEDGTYAFADTLKRVPNRYRDQVTTRQLGRLTSYERWTPSNLRVKGDHTDRLASNLERLREVNAELDRTARGPKRVHARGGAANAPSLLVRTHRNGSGLNLPLTGDAPVVLESVRTKLDGEDATRGVTLVRQGGEVIAVFKGHNNSRSVVEVDVDDLLDDRAIDETTN
ncbi:MAG: DUF4124 domain-containing protein [Myxococcota bacterium]|nr:DUF4124 domain-containing protein [Myxococcales bacterium]